MRVAKVTALVVDGEGETSQLRDLKATLAGAGVECVSSNCEQALRDFYVTRPDILILTLAPPGDPVWEVLETVRRMATTPAIALTSPDRNADPAASRRFGADAYVRHDAAGELVARIEALLRASPPTGRARVIADDFIEIDLAGHRVTALGTEVALTPTEFRLLTTLAEHPGDALTHEQLLSMVWDQNYSETNEVKLYVSYLRRKLRRAAAIDPVETVRGIGYRYRPRKLAR